jgi:hypothetical protein
VNVYKYIFSNNFAGAQLIGKRRNKLFNLICRVFIDYINVIENNLFELFKASCRHAVRNEEWAGLSMLPRPVHWANQAYLPHSQSKASSRFIHSVLD